MLIRESIPEDIPKIISVLKASLGEADLPLSVEIWNYKHVINPFGESIVLLAEENGNIAGVRAFMRWKWQRGEEMYSAFRAVDTATHPDFQGKGVFKKLTLRAVEMGIEDKDDFIFNTPNDKSRPGYLKMGWEVVGKLEVGLQPAWNSFYKINQSTSGYHISRNASVQQIDKLCSEWNMKLLQNNKIFTPKSSEYLAWRYENNPLQEYEIYAAPNLYMAGYVKKRKNIKELRISECIFSQTKIIDKPIHRIINKWSSKFGVQVISYSPELFPSQVFSIKGNFGPILTTKNLNLQEDDLSIHGKIGNWNYSIGDLELF